MQYYLVADDPSLFLVNQKRLLSVSDEFNFVQSLSTKLWKKKKIGCLISPLVINPLYVDASFLASFLFSNAKPANVTKGDLFPSWFVSLCLQQKLILWSKIQKEFSSLL